MLLTRKQFKEVFKYCKEPDEWYEVFDRTLKNEAPNLYRNSEMYCAFMAQIAHESSQFNKLSENLNYSKESLVRVFPKYFKQTDIDLDDFHRKPRAIANLVYAKRLGNTEEGDGWKFRGGGLIHLTGRQNYARCAKHLGFMLLDDPDCIRTNKELALKSTLWFWNKRKVGSLNRFANRSNFKKLTRKINGGYNGLEDRQEYFVHLLNVVTPIHLTVVKLGSSGDIVKAVQNVVGAEVDGVFGVGTQEAVKEYQRLYNLPDDGVVGSKTFNVMIEDKNW